MSAARAAAPVIDTTYPVSHCQTASRVATVIARDTSTNVSSPSHLEREYIGMNMTISDTTHPRIPDMRMGRAQTMASPPRQTISNPGIPGTHGSSRPTRQISEATMPITPWATSLTCAPPPRSRSISHRTPRPSS